MVAKQNIGEKVLIPYLKAYFAEVKSNQFQQHFSQLKIDDRNHIMLGPLSFVNHSCNPNAQFTRQDFDANLISLRTIRRIAQGEEILVNYGKRYFAGACLCMSCKMAKEYTMNLNGSELVFKWPLSHPESQIIRVAYQRWLPDFPQTFEIHDLLEFTELMHRFRTLMESTKVAEAQYIECEPLGNVLDYCCYRAKIDQNELNKTKAFSPDTYGETTYTCMSSILQQLPIDDDDVFLDLGSGIGTFVLFMAASVKLKESFGIERMDLPSKYAEQIAKEFDFMKKCLNIKTCEIHLLSNSNSTTSSKRPRSFL